MKSNIKHGWIRCEVSVSTFEGEYSPKELVALMHDSLHILDSMQEGPFLVDSPDEDSRVLKLSDAPKFYG